MMHELQARLERLERQNVAMRRWLVLLAAVMVTGLVVAAGPGVVDEVRARRFTLVDSAGEEVGVVGVARDGTPLLMLGGPGDSQRVFVNGGSESGFAVMDGKRMRISAYIGKDGSTEFGLAGRARSNPSINMAVRPDGAPHFTMRDADDNELWRYPKN